MQNVHVRTQIAKAGFHAHTENKHFHRRRLCEYVCGPQLVVSSSQHASIQDAAETTSGLPVP